MKAEDLKRLGVRLDRANAFAHALTQACAEFRIDTLARQASFLGQILHESGMLKHTRELWGPTPQQVTYERDIDAPWGPDLKRGDRNFKAWTLGNLHPGDGFRFRGRGLIQTTGRDNYIRAGRALGVDFIRHPEALETPLMAARSAGYFWGANNLNDLADAGLTETISRRVNGGINGLAERLALTQLALETLA